MNKIDIRIFFDESGKRDNKPNLMGAISLPSILYNSNQFKIWTDKLQDKKIKLHWVGFTGDNYVRQNILNIMFLIAKHNKMIKFNIINYNYSALALVNESKENISKTIYFKFPERLIYGILRGYGKNVEIEAYIDIEDATEYRSIKLDQIIKEHLNVQSTYRGEQFKVRKSSLISKKTEIGLEITDLLLGFVRTIILNEPDTKSKSIKAKNDLIILLLENKDFYSFLEKSHFYEWTKTRMLSEVDMSDYIQIFLASHQKFENI